MTSENVAAQEAAESGAAVSAKAVDDQLIDELVSRAHAECLQLTGHGGLLQQALGAEGRLAQDPASYGVVRGMRTGSRRGSSCAGRIGCVTAISCPAGTPLWSLASTARTVSTSSPPAGRSLPRCRPEEEGFA